MARRGEGEAVEVEVVTDNASGKVGRTAGGRHILWPLRRIDAIGIAVSSEGPVRGHLNTIGTATLPGIDSTQRPSAQDRIGERMGLH